MYLNEAVLDHAGIVKERSVSAEVAVRLVKPGQRVFVGTGCATPRGLVKALEASRHAPEDVMLVHFLTSGALALDGAQTISRFRHTTFFVGSDFVGTVEAGTTDYIPISLAEVPGLLDTGRFVCDVAFIQVTPPDRWGYVSLGVSVDLTLAMVRHARTVIAELNPNMPRTGGETTLHVDNIDRFVWTDVPVIEYSHPPSDEIASQIARYIGGIIEDGSTLQIGLGRIPNEALKYMEDRRDLGIHSDVITDTILPLIDKRIVTGRRKSMQPGVVVTSFCLGTRALYDRIDGNPLFSFHPIEQICKPEVIAGQNRMVSITQAFAVDLTGSVCVDQYEGRFYGGVATQPDFMRGAARSKGGKPIICLRSTTDDSEISRIRPLLQTGEGTAIPRSDVHYVITENGIAYLYGKSIRQRALALIEIAHPDHRPWLLEEAKRLGYLPAQAKLSSAESYRIAEERITKVRDGREVMIRPARLSDAQALRDLIHHMHEDDVYTRFFRRLKSLSFNEAQRLCNTNYSTEVAFMAVAGPREEEEVVASGCYFVNPTSNLAEVGYMVGKEWQGTGLGKILQERLKEFALKSGIRGFEAEILKENARMIGLAKEATNNVSVRDDEDCLHVTMIF